MDCSSQGLCVLAQVAAGARSGRAHTNGGHADCGSGLLAAIGCAPTSPVGDGERVRSRRNKLIAARRPPPPFTIIPSGPLARERINPFQPENLTARPSGARGVQEAGPAGAANLTAISGVAQRPAGGDRTKAGRAGRPRLLQPVAYRVTRGLDCTVTASRHFAKTLNAFYNGCGIHRRSGVKRIR